MLLLGIDTSTRRVGVAVGGAAGVRAQIAYGGVASSGPPRHAEQLVPAIDTALHGAGVVMTDLDAIAVGIGPGMFTGLRVGIVTATVLAQALDLPIVAVPSLDLLAFPLRHTARDLIVPVIDARRAEVYWASYAPVPGGVERVDDDDIAAPSAVAAELAARGRHALVCGDGAIHYAAEFAAVDHVELAGPDHASPDLAALLALGALKVEHGEVLAPSAVVPRYLRQSDAEINASPRGTTVREVTR